MKTCYERNTCRQFPSLSAHHLNLFTKNPLIRHIGQIALIGHLALENWAKILAIGTTGPRFVGPIRISLNRISLAVSRSNAIGLISYFIIGTIRIIHSIRIIRIIRTTMIDHFHTTMIDHYRIDLIDHYRIDLIDFINLADHTIHINLAGHTDLFVPIRHISHFDCTAIETTSHIHFTKKIVIPTNFIIPTNSIIPTSSIIPTISIIPTSSIILTNSIIPNISNLLASSIVPKTDDFPINSRPSLSCTS